MLYTAPLTGFEDRSNWKIFLDHDPKVRIEQFVVLKSYVAVEIRVNGLNEIKLFDLSQESKSSISFPEPVYTVALGGNPEYDAKTIRYTYTSLNRPSTLYEYNLENGQSTKLKEQEIPSGFNPDDYVVERLWAKADDGVEVPMAIVYKKGLKRTVRTLLCSTHMEVTAQAPMFTLAHLHIASLTEALSMQLLKLGEAVIWESSGMKMVNCLRRKIPLQILSPAHRRSSKTDTPLHRCWRHPEGVQVGF